MGVEVTVTGTGRWAGAKSNIDAYEVIEDSTPTEASDSSGGTGQLKFKAIEDPSRFGSALLLNNDVELSDGDRGLTQGKINDITSNEGILDITADSRLGRLVIDKTALPVHDTFANVITYYLSLGGITTGIAIDPIIGAVYVEAPGWTGDLWTKIKELCVVYGAEIALLRTNVAVRPVRQRRALEINNSSEQWVISNRELAKQVEVCYYNTQWKEDSLIYPKGGWTPDVPIYTVDAGQTITVNIPVGVSLTSITPLTAFSSMPMHYTGPSSGYCVIGNDNQVVSVSQWNAGGGLITAEIGPDGSSIDLTIVGANTPYGPYRIAGVEGTTFYSSLRIQGDGIHYERNSIIVDTAADETTTSRDIGVTVDNIFIETEAQARSLALDVASRWATPRRELRITKSAISKPGETGQDYDFATFAQFDAYAAANSIVTFADFDAAWAGDTFADFDNYWYDLVSDDFDYQVFGNVNGARVAWRRAMWRIRTASIGMDSVQYTAEEDTTFADFDASANRTPLYSWSTALTNFATNPSFEMVTAGTTVLRTNLIARPNPSLYTGSGWAASPGTIDFSGEWKTDTATTTGTPYFFTDRSAEAIEVGDVVTMAIDIRLDSPNGNVTHARIRPHKRTGNVYYGLPFVVVPLEEGVAQRVVLQWTATEAIPANDLDIAVTGADASGAFAGAFVGFKWSVKSPIIERGVTHGTYFDGSTPDEFGWDYAWTGTVDASTSTASASAVEVRRNYHANPKLEVNSTGWYQSSATSRTAVTIPGRPEILFAFKSAGPVSAANNRTVVATLTGLTPGATYTATLLVRIDGNNWVYGVWDTEITVPTPPTITSRPVAAMTGWREESITFVAVSSSASVGLNANGAMSNVEYGITAAVIEAGSGTFAGYFDGSTSTDPDLTPAWTGATDASQSILQGALFAGVAAANPAQAQRWSTGHSPYAGSASARYRLETTSAIGIPVANFSPATGDVYTLLMRVRPNSRDLLVRPRIRGATGDYTSLPMGVWTEMRLTIETGSGSTAQTGLLIDSDSGHVAGDTVDVDNVVLIEGDYIGPYFDGDTADPSDTTRYAWSGTPHGSISSYEVYNLTGYTGMTFADFDASYAGLTFADFALIPLPNVESQYDRF